MVSTLMDKSECVLPMLGLEYIFKKKQYIKKMEDKYDDEEAHKLSKFRANNTRSLQMTFDGGLGLAERKGV